MILLLRHCCLFSLLACTLFCGCLGLPYDITSTHAVRRLYYQKLDKEGRNKGDSEIKGTDVAHFGEEAFILESYLKHWSPDINERLVFTRERKFVRLNFTNLRAVSLTEFPDPMTPEEKKAFIVRFSNVLWTGSVISGIKDIPKYKAGSLTAEVEKAIVPPDYNNTRITVYTYANLGGQVNTFTFIFTPEGKLADITRVELGKNIGDFFYLL
jgi:hypothetical protein